MRLFFAILDKSRERVHILRKWGTFVFFHLFSLAFANQQHFEILNFVELLKTSPYRIGLVGLGTIGTGVAKLLLHEKERISQAAGRPVELVCICDKDTTRDRGIDLPPGLLCDDLSRIENDPEISLVVELAGGIDFPRKLVLSLLEKGKSIVSANKALIANCGPEIFQAARKHGQTIAFEAAVCGGIPILGAISTSLQANSFRSIVAIVNGTCNFILTQMEEKGADYEIALREAQRLGYAEADPTLDVDGSDAAQKLAILAQLGFGIDVDWKKISREGIRNIETVDISYAKELGYRIRLLAVAYRREIGGKEGLELHVSPTLVPESSSIGQVRDAFNAVEILGDAVGPVFFRGYGAGELPTASSVVGDIIDTILGRTAITFQALDCWSERSRNGTLKLIEPEEHSGKSYLRLLVEDRPGVVHEISGVLGRFGISVASMIQHESRESDQLAVPLVITTHTAKEGDMRGAMEMISKLDSLKDRPVRLRVLDF